MQAQLDGAVTIINAIMKSDYDFTYRHPLDYYWVISKRGQNKITVYPTKDKVRVGADFEYGIIKSINKRG